MQNIIMPIKKAGHTRTLHSPTGDLRESAKKRHYKDTTHNYGNFFEVHAKPKKSSLW